MKTKCRFFPFQKPYKTGYVKHKDARIYYELYGHKNGRKVMFHHGGPGSAPKQEKSKYFPAKLNLCLYHQRGCGKSMPSGLAHNKTQQLVEDTQVLMDRLGWQQAVHVGSSWGTTLALCFAIAHPQKVCELILTGIFLGTRPEIDLLFRTNFVEQFSPLAWEKYISRVPQGDDPLEYYAKKIKKGDDESLDYVKDIFNLEASIMTNGATYDKVKKYNSKLKWDESLPIQASYMVKDCFLPPNYILDSAFHIASIPTIIVQGSEDRVCLPIYAHKLAEKLKRCKLYLVEGGHMMSESKKKQKLLEVFGNLEKVGVSQAKLK